MSFYTVNKRSKKSASRTGTITTAHGTVLTPAFVPVGTKGTIKALPQPFIKEIGIQMSFVNTYHLITHPGMELLQKVGGIHNLAKYEIPLMSDSGGFQVFSLAQSSKRKAHVRGDEDPLMLKISEDGVRFRSVYDGEIIEFTPEKSMEYQKAIGADLMMAFDECTYYPATHEYAEKAMKRTHEWLKRCISYKKTNLQLPIINQNLRFNDQLKIENSLKNENWKMEINQQYLYGIIQGGTYEDLRIASAKFVTSQDVDGVAIGGVSVGETKEEIR